MAKLSKEEIDVLLDEPQMGVLATADAEGVPEGSPVWFEHRDGELYVLVGGNSKKARNVRVNPRVALTVDTRRAPYKGVILRGRTAISGPDLELRRRLAHRYLGKKVGDGYLAKTAHLDAEDVLLTITVDSRFSWDYAKGF